MASAPQTGEIDTANVKGRREVRFNTVEEALSETDRLAALDRQGRLKALGNWTFGQAVGHLATWAEYAFTGSPIRPPWVIRMVIRFMKKRMIFGKLPVGVKIPKVEGGTLGVERVDLDVSLPRFVAAMTRLRDEAPTLPNAAFGPLTHEEHIALNLRHTELHLSFFVPS